MQAKTGWFGPFAAALVALAGFASAGCETQGSFEEAGEEIDEAIDEAEDIGR